MSYVISRAMTLPGGADVVDRKNVTLTVGHKVFRPGAPISYEQMPGATTEDKKAVFKRHVDAGNIVPSKEAAAKATAKLLAESLAAEKAADEKTTAKK